jgi:UDP-glucose 4-epimerase
MVVPRFVGQALTGADLTVYGDGQQSRCFMHIEDAVRALLGLLGSGPATGGVYNVGSSRAIRIIDLAHLVLERTGSTSSIRYVPFDIAYEPGFEDLDRRVPNTSAVKDMIGWTPERTVEDAVDDVIEHFRVVPDDAGTEAASTRDVA